MKRTNFLPLLVGLTACAALSGLLNVSLGQNSGDEIIIQLDEDVTPAQAEPEEDPGAKELPENPAPNAAVTATGAFNPVPINQRISRLEQQSAEILANQEKIDALLIEIAEEIRLARIYASRTGGGAPSNGGE